MLPSPRCSWLLAGRVPGGGDLARDEAWAGVCTAAAGMGPSVATIEVPLDGPGPGGDGQEPLAAKDEAAGADPGEGAADRMIMPGSPQEEKRADPGEGAGPLELVGRGVRCRSPDCRLPDRFMPLATQLAASESAVVEAARRALGSGVGWLGVSWKPGAPALLFSAAGLPLEAAPESQGWATFVLPPAPSPLGHRPPSLQGSQPKGPASGEPLLCAVPPQSPEESPEASSKAAPGRNPLQDDFAALFESLVGKKKKGGGGGGGRGKF